MYTTKFKPEICCTACGAQFSRDEYGEAVCRDALYDEQANGLIEDGYCPECGASDVVEEVE